MRVSDPRGATMKIVILDGHTLNPGDLSWDNLSALGDCAAAMRRG